MSKLTILRGVSGGGKSTFAESYPFAFVVSRDDLRKQYFGSDGQDYYRRPDLRDNEQFITNVEHALIETALKAGKHVIVDNTHVEWKYVRATAAIGQKLGADIDIKVFDVPLNTAQNRAIMRFNMGGREVPLHVIETQHKRLQGTKNMTVADLPAPFIPEPYSGTPGKPKAFLVDIDGTLAHMRKYRGPFDWHKVHLDDVDDTIAEIVLRLKQSFNGWSTMNVIVMSGRDEVCRFATERWLDEAGIPFDYLLMRPEKDQRKDSIIKEELFNTYVRDNFDVQFVLDDRQQVVDMWRAKGLTCLQVAPGDF